MTRLSTHRDLPARVRAFSLVEVLIAVIVLSLGLLGLAAVFPTVVRQQQTALDSVEGLTIASTVEGILRRDGKLTRGDLLSNKLVRGERASYGRYPGVTLYTIDSDAPLFWMGWHALVNDRTWSPLGEWAPVGNVTGSGLAIDPAGTLTLGAPRDAAGDWDLPPSETEIRGGVVIPVWERLLPNGTGSAEEPKYVWDFVARRVDTGVPHPTAGDPILNPRSELDRVRLAMTYFDDAVELAVFVRRIDNGIRVPSGQRLHEVLRYRADPGGGGVLPPTRVPVAADGNGLPTFDGAGANGTNYSRPLTCSFEPVDTPGHPEWVGEFARLTVDAIPPGWSNEPRMLRYASQVGQKLIDRFGNVYTVVTTEKDRAPRGAGGVEIANLVQISPRLDARLLSEPAGRTLLFTPQVPAVAFVTQVEPWKPTESERFTW
jgi:hypothetical protein